MTERWSHLTAHSGTDRRWCVRAPLVQMNTTPAAFIQGLPPLNDVNEAVFAAIHD